MSKAYEFNQSKCITVQKARIKDLEKENEQLKHDATVLIQANQDYRKENEQLKSILKIYHKVANCRNCHYHDYDTLFGGYDDYEICNKGNDVSDGICSEWREH